MIQTPLDRPEDIMFACKLCGGLMKVSYHWLFGRWMHPSVHQECRDRWDAQRGRNKDASIREIPERFQNFEPLKANQAALSETQGFGPESEYRTLAIVGVRALGKSRLMWATIGQFFDLLREQTGANRWVDAFTFNDLITEYDRGLLNRVKGCAYCFVDDLGSTESYGRERAQLQSVIRARVQKGQWTFLTIDDINFDPGLSDFFRDRAQVVQVTE